MIAASTRIPYGTRASACRANQIDEAGEKLAEIMRTFMFEHLELMY
jgi:hypothetical protein